MRFTRAAALAAGLMMLLISGCGSDDDEGASSTASEETGATTSATDEAEEADVTTTTSAETTTTATAEETTTTEAASTAATSEFGFPETPVATFLSQTYLFGSEQGIPSADQLPFPPNSVSAHWYQSDGVYVVTYGGLAPELVLCPGNSIQTAAGFEHVSNAPLAGADCSFAPTVADAPSGVVTCNRIVSYVTLIPAGTEGVLFGTVESMVDGLGVGLTSQVAADPANMPEVDRSVIDC